MVDDTSEDEGNGRPTPTLVEVNTRWHLTDFGPLTDACVGYNAVEETLSAYLDPERFEALPRVPPTGEDSRYGRVVHLVSFVEGPLESICHEQVRYLVRYLGEVYIASTFRQGLLLLVHLLFLLFQFPPCFVTQIRSHRADPFPPRRRQYGDAFIFIVRTAFSALVHSRRILRTHYQV